MTADARTARPGVIVVSTGRCGSTMLSNMLRLNPGILSLSEFFSLLMPDPFPAGELDAAAYWRLLSEPWVFFKHAYRLGLRVPEFLYAPGPGSRFTAATGIPPILVTALPHLSDDPEGLYDAVEAFAAGLTPASAAAQHRRLIGWLCDRLGARAWVERSGSSLLYISQLVGLFRDARFVHLYRDGRECAYSFSRHPGYRLGAVSAMLTHAWACRLTWATQAAGAGAARSAAVHAPDIRSRSIRAVQVPVAECGQFWSDMIIPALDVLPPAYRRVLQVSYEDLVAEPRQVLLRAGALRSRRRTPPRLARPCRATGRAAFCSLAGPAARPDPRADPRVRACDAAALRRLVVIVPCRAPGARTKTGSQASGAQNLSPRRSGASAGRQRGPGDPQP